MKTLQLACLISSALLAFISMEAQDLTSTNKNIITSADLENLHGPWKGTLTYMDYTSNNPFTMPTNVEVISKGKNKKVTLLYKYPQEPKANSKGSIKISKNGTFVNGKPIISRKNNGDGTVEITAVYAGKDGNESKKATIRNIYIIGSEKFVIRKEVQFLGTSDWIKRNEYNFIRA